MTDTLPSEVEGFTMGDRRHSDNEDTNLFRSPVDPIQHPEREQSSRLDTKNVISSENHPVRESSPFMNREHPVRVNILEKALAVTRGDRQEAYGSPMDNWTATVSIFNAMTGRDLSPSEGVKFAIAMKLARLKNSPYHLDSMVDLAGYAWVYSEVAR